MKFKILSIMVTAVVLLGLAAPALANPPYPEEKIPPTTGQPQEDDIPSLPVVVKPFDQPNPKDYWRNEERWRLLEQGRTAEANALGLSGTDRVLVILVEFAGTDVFTWTAGVSAWDPLGRADTDGTYPEYTGTPPTGVCADCQRIITQTQVFTYSGPLHNQIPRPLSESDRSGNTIWTEDFSPQWFYDFMFGDGVVFDYARQDGSRVYLDYRGMSVKHYYAELSDGVYNIDGDVIGWLKLPHSTWWYGADLCPGARSVPDGVSRPASAGGIPGAGNARSLVRDALDAVNAISNTIPGFSWKNYDKDGDGIIDRLWIVHAGYGEEDSTVLLNRTDYGEAALWSHSASVTPPYYVGEGVSAGPYIMMPENGGIGVFAHEYGHNLGADDLYAYGRGNTSAGFWTLMADDWTGYPIGFLPPSVDPWHLDRWGWLNPKVIFDPNQVYQVTVGQASNFPGGAGVYRGVKIQLPNGQAPLPLPPWQGSYYWWGGKQDLMNAMMTTKNPIAIPATATTATLSFDLAYDIEEDWDFLWVQVSEDGVNWYVTKTLTNAHTSCTHDPDWIGALYGFPDDLCGAGLGGFSGYGHFAPTTETFDLAPYIGKSIYLRWWYMTDWATTGWGPFVDNVRVQASTGTLFADDAESGDANWNYQAPWQRNTGILPFTHNFYLQWRNVGPDGGYDQALGDARWRYGPANTGLLVWYNNNFYADNEIFNYLEDWPSFGPKGRMLVIESHPQPYRDPDRAVDYPNSIANLTSRGQMRDAPFSRNDTVPFTYPSVVTPGLTNSFAGRPAESMFTDARGYYAGIEYARRGKLPCGTFQWYDQIWDASGVVPARDFYSLKATGGAYAGQGLRMLGFINPAGLCGASWYGFWYPPYFGDGNTGNPIDSNVDYGWRVQILSQTAQTATLKIWNIHYYGALWPDKTVANLNDTVRYTFQIKDNQGGPVSLYACVPLDTSKVEYVEGSATNGATLLNESCDGTAGQAIGWTGYVDHGGTATFSFDVRIKAGVGLMDQNVHLYKAGELWATIPAQPVKVNAAYTVYLPIVLKQ